MTSYNVTVEMNLGPKLAEGAADTMLGRLEGFSPAIGYSDHRRLEVTLTVPAETLWQAVHQGVLLAEEGTRLKAIHVEAIATDLFDARLGLPAMPELVSVSEAAEILEITRQRVLQLVQGGQLPSARVGNGVVIPRAAVEARVDRLSEPSREP